MLDYDSYDIVQPCLDTVRAHGITLSRTGKPVEEMMIEGGCLRRLGYAVLLTSILSVL